MLLPAEGVQLQVGGIGGVEWFILLVIFIVFLFGSKKLPEIIRALGKAIGEFEKARMEFRREIEIASQPKNVLNPLLTPTTTSASTIPPENVPLQPQQPQTKQTSKDREFLMRLAQDLNIRTEGKTDEQIWEEMRKKLLSSKNEKEEKAEAAEAKQQTETKNSMIYRKEVASKA